MSALLKEANKIHQNSNTKVEEKTELIDECIERREDCPCGSEECKTDTEELEELGSIYEKVMKEVILKKVEEEKCDQLKDIV